MIAAGLFFLALLSQFGGRLSARDTVAWWAIIAFALLCATVPSVLAPIATLLGVQVVSNLVLATLILLLMLQSVEHSTRNTALTRGLRELTSVLASDACPLEAADPGTSRVLVVAPCLNEESALPELIAALQELTRAHEGIDWLIVDDGSEAPTRECLGRLAPANHVRHRVNLGVGGVLLTGFRIADRLNYSGVVQCDADGQHPVAEIPRLVDEAGRRELDLLVGSRFLAGDGGGDAATTPLRRAGSRLIVQVLRSFGPAGRVGDPTSGFRFYSSAAVRILLREMPDEYPEPESLAVLAIRGAALGETSVTMRSRSTGRSTIVGAEPVRFMVKVLSALVGLRLRALWTANPSKVS